MNQLTPYILTLMPFMLMAAIYIATVNPTLFWRVIAPVLLGLALCMQAFVP